MTKLVIVESPAKARTIEGYLGEGFDVQASVGHIRDLPQPSELPADLKKSSYGKFAVDVDGDFEPYYVVDADKKKKVAELRRHLKDADELYLATDEDREGEAIAWHLLQVLKPKVPVSRMVFHEITQEAIDHALKNTRPLDVQLVDAQESRRILDRLVGYELSPLLWRKVATGLSAGRVQSVATRMVVERERERMAFRPATYFSVTGIFSPDGAAAETFSAKLTHLDDARVAVGKDFLDDGTMKPKAKKDGVIHIDADVAEAIAAAAGQASFTIDSVESKPYTRRPAAPFTTSTLQQEAARKLRMSARETMRVAQSLYENGYITYMRTDSTALSGQAIAAARTQAAALYGAASVPEKPRFYAKKAKGAQEAHEAIRPAGDNFRTPDKLRGALSTAQHKLYDLIWKRTIASQMTDARGKTATVKVAGELAVGAQKKNQRAIFSASGTVITERGFLAAYEEGRDQSRYDSDPQEGRLPQVSEGQRADLHEVEAGGHETTPPPRYTEASLVKALEERGIGRPSTYAATISVITERHYVDKRGQALVPTWLAFSVTRLLEENLPRLVDYDFTAQMEADLDEIAAGQKDRVEYLRTFYHGGDKQPGLQQLVAGLGDIDARAVNSIDLGEGLTLRVGRYGPYVESDDGDKRASVPEDVAPDELTAAKARELLEASADDGRVLGQDPHTGRDIVARNGRFGPYVTEVLSEEEAALTGRKKIKPRTGSLFKDMDLATVTLEQALQLLSLPRVVGKNADGEEITAQNGRYGPYIKCGKESRSLETEAAIFAINEEEAIKLLSQPKTRRGQKSTAPLREFGEDPVSGTPVVLKDGRFGPYVTDGSVNASVPRGTDPAELTAADAFELLVRRREKVAAQGGKKRPARRTTKKATTKKATAKKSTAKKSTAKKSTATKAASSAAKKSASTAKDGQK